MKAEQILEDVLVELQKQGVRVTRHPTGTRILTVGEGKAVIFPYIGKWKVQYSRVNLAPYHDEEFTHGDIEELTLTLLRWGWNNGAKPL